MTILLKILAADCDLLPLLHNHLKSSIPSSAFPKTKVERPFKVCDVRSPISTALIITYHNLFFPKDERTFKVCDERSPGSGEPDPQAKGWPRHGLNNPRLNISVVLVFSNF